MRTSPEKRIALRPERDLHATTILLRGDNGVTSKRGTSAIITVYVRDNSRHSQCFLERPLVRVPCTRVHTD